MLDLRLKQYIREHFEGRMNFEKMRVPPYAIHAIIVRPQEMEQFIDDLWVSISKKEHEQE